MLVIRDEDSLGLSLTICEIQRRFLKKFKRLKDDQVLSKRAFPISMVNFRTPDGSNIFHFLVLDFKILKKFQQNYMKYIDTFEDEDDKKKQLELFLLILYPNNFEISPFEMALKQSSQYVDLFLSMLTEVPDYLLSKFIFKELSVFK